MKLRLRDNLPFCEVTVNYFGQTASFVDVLVDTGSARTIFAADLVSKVGIMPEPNDILETIRGVGGVEIVYTRQVNEIRVAEHIVSPFMVEIGAMDYGFKIDGIMGMDFLRQSGAVLNLSELTIEFI